MAEESKQLSFRLAPTFYEQLEQKAKKLKISPSQFARELVINALNRTESDDQDLSAEILRLDARLDEITDLLRTRPTKDDDDPPVAAEPGPTLDEIEGLLTSHSESIRTEILRVRKAVVLAVAGLLTQIGRMDAKEAERWVKERFLDR
jgi:hypothetical protein